MELITKEYKVFSFEELKQEVKDKVIEKFRSNKESCDYDILNENIEDSISYFLDEEKLPKESICFDLSGYKGYPFISFKGKIDLNDFLKKHKKITKFKKLLNKNMIYLSLFIDNKTEYKTILDYDEEFYFNDYEDDLRIEITNKQKEELIKLREELIVFVEEKIQEVKSKAIKSGLKEIEYFYSDECIKEDIQANDYKFLEDGSIFKG